MISNSKLKQDLYALCVLFVENRYKTIQKTINEIQESLTSETKSSAGDKHETGRAMLQLEREKAGNQLAEIQKIKEQLSKINTSNTSKCVGLGSIVFTNQNNYFIAVSVGELKVENQLFYAISPNTPIGTLLMGKAIGDVVAFRQQKFTITSVL